jgi:hypothetical protein
VDLWIQLWCGFRLRTSVGAGHPLSGRRRLVGPRPYRRVYGMTSNRSQSPRRTLTTAAVFGVLAGAALIAAPGTASATEPVGGCPVGFELTKPSWISTQGTFYGLSAADLNQDTFSCVRFLVNSPTELAFMDNRLPLS